MISSTVIGEPMNPCFAPSGPKVDDVLILSGPIGAHGLAMLRVREKIPFQSSVESDCASLLPLLEPLIHDCVGVHELRDVTRGGLGAVLHEWSRQNRVSFEIDERLMPIAPEVKAGLTLLGIDPMEVANEGVMLISVAHDQAERTLALLRRHTLGANATIVGRVKPESDVPVVLVTALGGRRFVPWPEALNLPRIC
jgi:hydrogenase expression/formation protein HypE